VCGEFDQATPPALNKLIADKVPGARYVELPGCGHCPPLEQPQQFLAAISNSSGCNHSAMRMPKVSSLRSPARRYSTVSISLRSR